MTNYTDIALPARDGTRPATTPVNPHTQLDQLAPVELHDLETAPRFTLAARGPMVRVPPRFLELHSGVGSDEPIDAHAVQPYYTLLLAREAGMTISIRAGAEEIVLVAE